MISVAYRLNIDFEISNEYVDKLLKYRNIQSTINFMFYNPPDMG